MAMAQAVGGDQEVAVEGPADLADLVVIGVVSLHLRSILGICHYTCMWILALVHD